MAHVEVLETSELGDRSYVVHDGRTAVVVDPQRDVDRVERVLAERGLTLAAVAETHIHNDYVSGGLTLAQGAGCDYLVAADDEVGFERRPVRDGEELSYGDLAVRVVHTPGHTPGSSCFRIEDEVVLFSGDLVFAGTIGRSDFANSDPAAMRRSLIRFLTLPDPMRVLPGHGAETTVGAERASNPFLREAG